MERPSVRFLLHVGTKEAAEDSGCELHFCEVQIVLAWQESPCCPGEEMQGRRKEGSSALAPQAAPVVLWHGRRPCRRGGLDGRCVLRHQPVTPAIQRQSGRKLFVGTPFGTRPNGYLFHVFDFYPALRASRLRAGGLTLLQGDRRPAGGQRERERGSLRAEGQGQHHSHPPRRGRGGPSTGQGTVAVPDTPKEHGAACCTAQALHRKAPEIQQFSPHQTWDYAEFCQHILTPDTNINPLKTQDISTPWPLPIQAINS